MQLQVTIVIPEDNLAMIGDIPAITYQITERFPDLTKIQDNANLLQTISLLYSKHRSNCDDLLQNRTIRYLLESYDIVITDPVCICSFMLPPIVNKRNIMLDLHGMLLIAIPYPAFPSHPAYIPQIGTVFSSKMTFIQRVVNTIVAGMKQLILSNIMQYLAYTIKHKYNIRPDLGFHEFMQSEEITLVAGDFAVNYARPLPPNIIMIGSLTSSPASPLPKDLEIFMQSSGDEGVILVSMGTIYELAESMVPTLLSGFKLVKQKIIWKTKLNVENAPDNVKVVKWMPQNDILGHKKLKAFISHGGSKGIFEAAYHGIPVIGMPLQVEQELNIAMASDIGIAISLDRNNLTPDTIVEAIKEIITNPRYVKLILL